MIFGSVCSGIEAASVAWNPLGWRAAFFAEHDDDPKHKSTTDFAKRLLAYRYPHVPNYGDLRGHESWPRSTIDVLCGGTPCQSYSIAGLREGIHDPRGALLRIFLEVVARYGPRWVVWENVPGVRSSDDGRALGTLFGGLGELGYGYAWASLDAQYRGLAQRRERVFVVGYLGNWRPAAAVLFDAASLRGDSAPRRETGSRVAPTIAGVSNGGGANGPGRTADDAEALVAGCLTAGRRSADEGERGTIIADTLRSHPRPGSNSMGAVVGTLMAHHSMRTDDAWNDRLLVPELSNALSASEAKGPNSQVNQGAPLIAHTLRGSGFDASEDGSNRGTPLVAVDLQQITHPENRANPQPGDPAPSLAARGRIAAFNIYPEGGQGADLCASPTEIAASVTVVGGRSERGTRLANGVGVRRLTPLECERLMGFPDNYTWIPVKRVKRSRLTSPRERTSYVEIDGQVWQLAADGPRYAALGNSWAVPVIQYIGERMQLVDAILSEAA